MRINSEKLKELAALSDEALWGEICKMGKNFGQSLPSTTPSHTDMERIRAALCGTQINVSDALELLRARRGEKK